MAEKSACTSASTRAAVASSVEPNRQSSVAKPAPSTIPAAVRPAAINRRQLTCRSRGRKRGTRKAGYRKGKLGSSDVACSGPEGGAQTRRAHYSSELAAGGRAIRRRIHAEAAARGARPGWDLSRGAPVERGRRGAHQRQSQRDRSGRLQRDGRKPAGAGRLRRSVPARDARRIGPDVRRQGGHRLRARERGGGGRTDRQAASEPERAPPRERYQHRAGSGRMPATLGALREAGRVPAARLCRHRRRVLWTCPRGPGVRVEFRHPPRVDAR